MRYFALGLTLLGALAFSSPASAKCLKKSDHIQVSGKTAVRRGPGLNYQVSTFLQNPRCLAFLRVSADKQWVMVRLGEQLGWVNARRLDKRSKKRILGATEVSSPIGSGVERNLATVEKNTALAERPQIGATPRRVLPKGLKVVPLAQTEDQNWIQVRDERGDVGWVPKDNLSGKGFAKLPKLDLGYDTGSFVARQVAPEGQLLSAQAPLVIGRVGAQSQGVHLATHAFIGALLPIHKLDSNGIPAIRRYEMQTVSGAAQVEAQVTDLGPITARFSYTFALLTGIAEEAAPNATAGGSQQEILLRVGLPFDFDGYVLTPELGYGLSIFDVDVALKGARNITFISNQVHTVNLGARVQTIWQKDILLEGSGAFHLGGTQTLPGNLGAAGLTVGGDALVGAQWLLDETIGIGFRYLFSLRTTDFSGSTTLDPTITEATLLDLTHGLMLGASISL